MNQPAKAEGDMCAQVITSCGNQRVTQVMFGKLSLANQQAQVIINWESGNQKLKYK